MKKYLALAVAFLAFAYSQVVWAGALGPWVGNLTPAGSLAYYASGNYSRALSKMGNLGTGPGSARWNPDLLFRSGLGVEVKQHVALPVGAGAAKTTLSGTISPSTLAQVAAAAIRGPAGVAVAVLTLPGVLDWLLQADLRPNAAKDGLESKDSSLCTVGPCYTYKTGSFVGNTPFLSCRAFVAGQNPGWQATYSSNTDTSCKWTSITYPAWGVSSQQILRAESRPPDAVAWKPATYPDYQQRLSGVPVSLDLINALLDAGYTFPLDGMSVTGPASVSAPPVNNTSTTINTAGDTITTTTTNNTTSNQTYNNTQPPNVVSTTTTTTTTNVYNNTTNTNISNTTTTQNKPDDKVDDKVKEEEKLQFEDKDLPDIPALYERKYPDGLSGVWASKIAAIKATPLFTLVGSLMPSVASSGSCPSWPLPLDFASWATFGTHDVAPPCWVWDFGKTVIIISSLLLARALIFGG